MKKILKVFFFIKKHVFQILSPPVREHWVSDIRTRCILQVPTWESGLLFTAIFPTDTDRLASIHRSARGVPMHVHAYIVLHLLNGTNFQENCILPAIKVAQTKLRTTVSKSHLKATQALWEWISRDRSEIISCIALGIAMHVLEKRFRRRRRRRRRRRSSPLICEMWASSPLILWSRTACGGSEWERGIKKRWEFRSIKAGLIKETTHN